MVLTVFVQPWAKTICPDHVQCHLLHITKSKEVPIPSTKWIAVAKLGLSYTPSRAGTLTDTGMAPWKVQAHTWTLLHKLQMHALNTKLQSREREILLCCTILYCSVNAVQCFTSWGFRGPYKDNCRIWDQATGSDKVVEPDALLVQSISIG